MRRTLGIAVPVMFVLWMGVPAEGGATLATVTPCGPTWTTAPAVDVGTAGTQLSAVAAIGPNDVWVGGSGPVLEHWDGTAFTVMPEPGTGGGISGIDGAASNDVWAVGGSTAPIQHWNGTSWSSSSFPLPRGASSPAFDAVTVLSANDVWAVGNYIKGGQHGLAEHWNGTAWAWYSLPNPPQGTPYPFGVAARASNDVWVVGRTQGSLGEQPFTERWNGTAWTVVPAPTFPTGENGLYAVTPFAADDALAFGTVGPAGSWDGVVEHWDGTAWTVSALLPEIPTAFWGARAVSRNDIWAVGNAADAPLLEHWDGVSWTRVSGPPVTPDGEGLAAVDALPSGDLWAAGDQSLAGTNGSLVERVCPVKVTDAGFAPLTVTVSRGLTTVWEIPGTDAGSHSVTDPTAMKLFDSGLRAPGGSFTYGFTAAGTYSIVDTPTQHRGTAMVPVVAPATATVGTPFSVGWASAPPGSGFVFDVQVRTPVSSTWAMWKTGATATDATYTASSAGTYSFRARLRKVGVGATQYSPPAAVAVT